MTKLNQIIAVVNGVKTKTARTITDIYKQMKQEQLFDGISRTYQPLDEDGETQPSEQKLVQLTVDNSIELFSDSLERMFDLVYTQDLANTIAKTNIVIDDNVLVKDVPVTYLLFLEKQLTDIYTFVNSLPVLNPAYEWEFDSNRNAYSTQPTATNKTKKVLRNHIKTEATEHHPAQVDVYTEDVKVGEWLTVKFSGSMPASKKHKMLDRITKLQDAVKMAREQANSIDVESQTIAGQLLEYIF